MILSDLIKNPISYWIRWVLNKNIFLFKNNKKNIKIDYMSYITNSTMENNTTLYQYVRLHKSHIGSYSYIANYTTLIGVKVGRFCSIGPNCRLGLGIHPTKSFVSTHPIFFSTESHVSLKFIDKNIFEEFKNIIIGNDVWIGANVLVKDGVTIGNGVIVGANSFVTKNIPPYAIVGGSPAKIIRYRFTQEEIFFLEQLKWWNQDIKDIKENYSNYSNINKMMDRK